MDGGQVSVAGGQGAGLNRGIALFLVHTHLEAGLSSLMHPGVKYNFVTY